LEGAYHMVLKKGLITFGTALGIMFAGTSIASASENNSIVDYLAAKGEDYSFQHRSELATANGIVGYRGTAVQNLQLLQTLRGTQSTPVHTNTVATQPAQAQSAQAAPSQPSGRSIQVSATAYVSDCKGCSGITATGINLKANPNQKVIAVDPKVIPLGSKVYVEGYGTAIAGDTGSAIKGNKIDLYMQNYADAIAFGRRTVTVTVLN
jgi:3D (Asp-Asp-Asp) domain-containing protein